MVFLPGILESLKKNPRTSSKAKKITTQTKSHMFNRFLKKNLYSYTIYKIVVDEYTKNLWYNLVLLNLKIMSCRDHAKFTPLRT